MHDRIAELLLDLLTRAGMPAAELPPLLLHAAGLAIEKARATASAAGAKRRRHRPAPASSFSLHRT